MYRYSLSTVYNKKVALVHSDFFTTLKLPGHTPRLSLSKQESRQHEQSNTINMTFIVDTDFYAKHQTRLCDTADEAKAE